MRKIKHRPETIILLILFIIYLIVLFKITIFRGSTTDVRNINLVPFTTISKYFRSISRGNIIIGISNLLGNLIIFLPLGYISPLVFYKMQKFIRILILSFILSLSIETSQYIFACGHTDIDDIILNTISGIIGYWIYILTLKSFKPKKYAIFISALIIASIYISYFIVSNYKNFFILPSPNTFPIHIETVNIDFNTNIPKSNTDETKWYLILINKCNDIPNNYEVELIKLSNGQLVDKQIYLALQEMFDTARSDGIYPIVASEYRNPTRTTETN